MSVSIVPGMVPAPIIHYIIAEIKEQAAGVSPRVNVITRPGTSAVVMCIKIMMIGDTVAVAGSD